MGDPQGYGETQYQNQRNKLIPKKQKFVIVKINDALPNTAEIGKNVVEPLRTFYQRGHRRMRTGGS